MHASRNDLGYACTYAGNGCKTTTDTDPIGATIYSSAAGGMIALGEHGTLTPTDAEKIVELSY